MIPIELLVDGIPHQEDISAQQLDDVYKPFAVYLLTLQRQLQRRIFVGIAGPPGSGKTYFSAIAARVIDKIFAQPCALSVGMDGWHYASQILAEKKIIKNGKLVSLAAVKGSPETFNVTGFCKFLNQAHQQARLPFPLYDRSTHDPRPQGGLLQAEHTILLVEGNYLLLDENPWQGIRPQLDVTCFIHAGEVLRWKSLLKRHLQGGKTAAQALQHIRRVDVPNACRIGRPEADIVLQRYTPQQLIVQQGLAKVSVC
jgi:hypothetical protein